MCGAMRGCRNVIASPGETASAMQIEQIEVINLRFTYPNEHGFWYGGGIATGRLTSLVLVHASGGQIGIGSVYSHPDLVRTIIEGHLRPLLFGRDPRDVEDLWHFMYRQTRWYGRKGAAIPACLAIHEVPEVFDVARVAAEQ